MGGQQCTSGGGGSGSSANPLVYGFSGGGAYCVPRSEIKYATRYCNNQSPLAAGDTGQAAQDKKRIIESFLKSKGQNVDLILNEEGKISEAQKKRNRPLFNRSAKFY